MPYINQKYRQELSQAITSISEKLRGIEPAQQDGCLNYTITRLLLDDSLHTSYRSIMRALGTLEAIKLEFYRRLAAPYEDKKRDENGDVYW